ncbi:hypothetical protein Ccrd_019088 [Cynara cardunculus var. scolymus]|uniref:Uncharacterized protein n=1 Tax=Cynara cardunculus var. scolymus TaxID=59895 RepID=A0A103Y4X8_CYNCS|nr:hypothetical protein Ccrd_019088 [Cynara cardunculus var. scolymus]
MNIKRGESVVSLPLEVDVWKLEFIFTLKLVGDLKTQRSKGEKERNPIYQTETAEPSYLSSSIYYGGQEVYPPTSHNTCSQRTVSPTSPLTERTTNRLELTILRKVEAVKILMEAVLQGEIGGKDLSTIENLASISAISTVE